MVHALYLDTSDARTKSGGQPGTGLKIKNQNVQGTAGTRHAIRPHSSGLLIEAHDV